MAKQQATFSYPALLRVTNRVKPLREVLDRAAATGQPIVLANGDEARELEDASAVDPSLATQPGSAPPPQSGTSYAGLTPTQRHAFITWSRQPETPAPPAVQQLYLANLEARLLEETYRQSALEKLQALGGAPTWVNNTALHRAYLLAGWLRQDG